MKKNAKSRAMIGVLVMALVVSAAFAQSAPKDQGVTKETQVRGFPTDPSTGPMWTAKDSGKDKGSKLTDRWAGSDASAPPDGQGDWAESVHDYNYYTNDPSSKKHLDISMFF